MIEIKTKLRKWGNSFGIVIPINTISSENIKEGEEVDVVINKKQDNILRETFGTFKTNKSTQKDLEEIDNELDSNF